MKKLPERALIIANGNLSLREIAKTRQTLFDLTVAADGGADAALNAGYSPNLVVGDLDSVSSAARQVISGTYFLRRPSQEINDLEKCLQECLHRHISHLTIIGAFGKRLDHTLNNLSILCRYTSVFNFTLYDAYSDIYLVDKQWSWSGETGQTISLIPLTPVARVTTSGLKYPLKAEALAIGMREGCSNRAVANRVGIRVEGGMLAIFVVDRQMPENEDLRNSR